jgi:hypothetical protein
MTLARGSRVRELLAQGIVPQELAAVGGTVEPQPGISETALRQGDIYHCVMSGGGGYLDPLEREPAAVGRDVAVGLVSAPCAADQYGVVVNAAGAVDAAATAARRTALRADRLARGQRPAATANGLAANGSAVANGHAADTERVQRVNEVLAAAAARRSAPRRRTSSSAPSWPSCRCKLRGRTSIRRGTARAASSFATITVRPAPRC